jgi:uncharacterized metal-binding protein (TIGR02443 family)
MEIKKRFIAGAVCPSCKAQDKVTMYREGEFDFRECIECGFKDQMRFKSVVKEIETRVNVSEQQLKTETQVVKIMPGSD